MITLTKQESMKQAAIEFANGAPIQLVMEKYNVCYASIYNAIKKFNIPYKKSYGRTIFFDEDFFECIDSELKAYWLGFIMADGNVSTHRVRINAGEKDREDLILFMQHINHSGKLGVQIQENSYAGTPIYHVRCNSHKMIQDLINLGCLPQKTGHSSLPHLSKHLIHHFIRGYFDGDGSISIYKQEDKRAPHYPDRIKQEFAITSDRNILTEIQEILVNQCILPYTTLKSYKNTTKAVSLRYGGKQQISRIYNYLYKDANVYLPRKYKKFSLLFS